MSTLTMNDGEVDISINQKLSKKIDQARWELQNGQCVTLSSHEDIDKLLSFIGVHSSFSGLAKPSMNIKSVLSSSLNQSAMGI